MIKRGYRCNYEGSGIHIGLDRFVYKHQCMSIDIVIKSWINKKKIVGTATNSSPKN